MQNKHTYLYNIGVSEITELKYTSLIKNHH